uniref:F-box domain-containing protein n=1 Tax=Monodelphis domestica TaxID=13616 RepID=F6T4L2_MONDO
MATASELPDCLLVEILSFVPLRDRLRSSRCVYDPAPRALGGGEWGSDAPSELTVSAPASPPLLFPGCVSAGGGWFWTKLYGKLWI